MRRQALPFSVRLPSAAAQELLQSPPSGLGVGCYRDLRALLDSLGEPPR